MVNAKALWESLERKYKTEDAGSKKFVVGKFLDFKMVDSKTVISQVQEFQLILHDIHAEGMVLGESFQVAALIEKLPPTWKDFKNYLKHKRKKMKLEDLIVRLRIEEDNRQSEKKAGNYHQEAKANVVEQAMVAVGGIANGAAGDKGGGYPGRLTWYVVFSSFAAAMGGFIFGYDLGISGGVTSMAPFLREFFPSVYRKEELNQSTNHQVLTLFTSSLYLAAFLSSFFPSTVTRRFGRRRTMMLGGTVFFIGAVLNAAAVHLWMLILGRILLGFGVGFANHAVPLYLSEMAPYKHRGKLNICFQLSITIGILLANLVNYGTAHISGGWGWRVSLGLAGAPAFLLVAFAYFLCETPNSLIENGKYDEARFTLQRIRGIQVDVEAEYDDLVAASEASKSMKDVNRLQQLLQLRQYRPSLVLAVLIPFFQQFTGINVIMFYAPELFRTIGFKSNASLISAVITGLVNFFATFVSIYGTDKWGRRVLFLVGGAIMLLFQIEIAVLIGTQFGVSGAATVLPQWFAIVVVACICCYVAAFAFSWGPLGWLVPSEISALEVRSAAQSLTVATNMLFTWIIAQAFLSMLCTLRYFLFFFFAAFVAVMTAFVYFFVPETKNVPIEEMSRIWTEHPYWKKVVTKNGAPPEA
ncbi:hypothetical protein RJ639_037384 [Escallonia herrerae]|uniref:Major facilitator superfamily (MFS) profile domain-containing protein n=1 Tax=Escallonia herrerae TaxID=1293975 RepID=A0AA89BH38_9ASTE|nr:hypothetical protein RJ639_037384 [Escallonia herrerae]